MSNNIITFNGDTDAFEENSDSIDFTGVAKDGTLAELAITNDNGTALGATTLDNTNSTVYVIDTDATELGSDVAAAISDFTDMSVVATFLNSDDGFITSDVSGKNDYFIINDGNVATASYIYHLVDNNNGTTTVESSELTLIGTITTTAGVIDVDDVTIA